MRRKTLVANPQTRTWTPENDCCNRGSAEQNHAPGCMNNPVNVKPQPEAPPFKKPQTQQLVAKTVKTGWCKFKSRGRCYVEGALLDDSDQEITLSPAGSYRQRNNRNLELIEGTIPVLPVDAPQRPVKNAEGSERASFLTYENSFIDSLEEGDPKVGAAPGGLRLLKQ